MDTVWMRSPDGGEVREVAAPSEELVQLMVSGWVQTYAPSAAAKEGDGGAN